MQQRCARVAAAVLATCSLVVAACGSTVPPSLTTPAAGDPAVAVQADGLGGPPPPGTTPASGAGIGTDADVGQPSSTAAGATAPTAGSTVARAPANPRQAPGKGSATPARSLPGAPGVTDDTIYVGAVYAPEAGAGNAAIGAAGIDPGDQRDYYNAVVDDLNKRGGIAGRKVKVVYYEAGGDDSSTQAAQEACTHWTQDNEVFAIFLGGDPIVLQCARKAGILLLGTTFSSATKETFTRYPNYIEIATVRLDRVGTANVEGLARTGYFPKRPTIGLITWDQPNYRRAIADGYRPALARLGFKPASVRYVTVPQSEAGLSDSSASVNSAVLEFRSEGVDHVMILDGPAGWFGGTGLTLLFLRSAGSQGYHPKYGFNQTNSPVSGLKAGLWTADDLRHSHAILWSDGPDDDADEGLRPNPQRRRCYALMRSRGVPLDNPNAQGFALAACDYVWFLEAVGAPAGRALTLDAVLATVDRLGGAYRSPLSYANHFSPTQHDGTAAARNAVYDEPCHCFRFVTGAYRLR